MTNDWTILPFEKEDPQRLDLFLTECLPSFSRARLQALIKGGQVRVNGRPVLKSGQNLEAPAQVEIHIPPTAPSDLLPEDIPLDILYEDQNVLVINKAAGMVVHPAAGHWTGTLVHAALAHAPEVMDVGGQNRPGIVHRLDKDTSGIILVAKTGVAHQQLQDQFRNRKVEKTYLALVDGHPPSHDGRIEAAIGRHPHHHQRMAVLPAGQGREATSLFHVRQSFSAHTLIEIHPLTGRTHQVRLHLAFLGSPVVGDAVYGRKPFSLPVKRQLLHAARLCFCLPGETTQRCFEAPLPDDLQHILDILEGK